jgi:hypothetical protein
MLTSKRCVFYFIVYSINEPDVFQGEKVPYYQQPTFGSNGMIWAKDNILTTEESKIIHLDIEM